MKTTTLGRSGLHDWGLFDEDAAVAAVPCARELGVNFIDTARRSPSVMSISDEIDAIMTSATPVAGPSPESV